ncbi:hypothetical protein A2335_02730 [Candidatus Peregrinibacteria bacterium RIFOXYB2_FULL_32_7]|nr:MAG: hypothetical protein A2335_02730 [Candidatus Peregrinibacteria bacterium RIFOXYB2_FULL_32_7]
METLLLILGLIGIAYLIYLLQQNSKAKEDPVQKLMFDMVENLRKELNESSGRQRIELQQRLDKIHEQISKHQTDSSETMRKQFVQSATIIKDVTERLTKLDETNKQVIGFAEQMKSLENILKNPKQRGILGEYVLEALLGNVLQPNQYKMQYKFENGEIVDAVVFFKDKIIPIDAKFSLEKYNMIMEEHDKSKRDQLEKEFKNDVKIRIDETSKYIRPNENTTEFAFMFIPAEGIYYNLLIYNVGAIDVNQQNLIEYAFKKKVIIASPTSFFAYLSTVLQGLKALKMEESVREIIKKVGELGKHINAYDQYMGELGKTLSTTVNKYNSASREFKKIDKDVYKITDGEEGGKIEFLELEKPNVE